MSSNERNTLKPDREIDMAMLSETAGGLYRGANRFIFRFFRFVMRKKWVLLTLLLIGAVGGYLMDRSQTVYEQRLIVTPNFGSVDYLYNKIDLINSKIKEEDTAFLKSIGLGNPKKLGKVKIEPVVDIYNFIQNNEERLEMVKLMAEDSDIRKIVVEPTTSKNYSFHQIVMKTREVRTSENLEQPLLEYLNDSDHYRMLQQQIIKNVANRIKEADSIIQQINGVLKSYADATPKSGAGVFINENSQLNDVILTKERIIREQGEFRIDQLVNDRIIKLSSSTLNVEIKDVITDNMKIILPLLLIGLYTAGYMFLRFYRAQSHRMESKELA